MDLYLPDQQRLLYIAMYLHVPCITLFIQLEQQLPTPTESAESELSNN